MNPSRKFSFRRRHSSRRGRNPGVAGFSTNELIKLAGGAAVGVLGSKYLTQLALGGNNAGAMGAVGQGVATLALAWAANKFAGKDVATGVVAGGFGSIAISLVNQYMGSGGNMSGLGDPDIVGLGLYQAGTIAVPSAWQSIVPAATASPRGKGR